jgi:hypothetical protein
MVPGGDRFVMEKVEGLIRNLKLTEKEEIGLKVGKLKAEKSLSKDPQAVRKVLLEKPVRADALENALGRIWCPIKGTECKDLGENHFLFTFRQHSGKRRALEDGPWNFGKDLVVVVDFDGYKTVDEMDFTIIPIWVRVMNLPLGFMTRECGEEIGNIIGEFVEMESEDGDLAVGQHLRIKVRLDITKPIMRGIKITVEEKVQGVWCPFAYEFLPDYCYNSGIIGHVEKSCEVPMEKGGLKPYSNKLLYMLEKKKQGDDVIGRGMQGRLGGAWRSGGSGSRGSWSGTGKSGSDAPSWRKEELKEGMMGRKKDVEKEVTSPIKTLMPASSKAQEQVNVVSKKSLFTKEVEGEKEQAMQEKEADEEGVEKGKAEKTKGGGGHVNSAMQATVTEPMIAAQGGGIEGDTAPKNSQRRYKRVMRDNKNLQVQGETFQGGKRSYQEREDLMEVDVNTK